MMARLLITPMPFPGHVAPLLPVARTLVARGHEVAWMTGSSYRSRVEATGARFVPFRHARDFDEATLAVAFPERERADGFARLRYDMRAGFIDHGLGQLEDLRDLAASFPFEAVLTDGTCVGPKLHYESGGAPWASLNVSPSPYPSRDLAPYGFGLPPSTSRLGRLRNRLLHAFADRVLFRDVHAHYQDTRWRAGLPCDGQTLFEAGASPFLVMNSVPEGFDYPRTDRLPQDHTVGAILPEPPASFAPPAWWDELDGSRPVVLVTQGTIATDARQLIRPTLDALAGEDVLVIATTGGGPIEAVGLGRIPSNARVERFVPFASLLPHVDAMVTNGGLGGVQLALAHGVPLVVSGWTEDKPEVGARVERAGAGLRLRRRQLRPDLLRTAVYEVLETPGFREGARRLQAEQARHDPPAEVAVLLERLVATGRPVLRPSAPRPVEAPAVSSAWALAFESGRSGSPGRRNWAAPPMSAGSPPA